MQAVLGADCQLRITAIVVGHDFIDASGAKALLGRIIKRQIVFHGHFLIAQLQVNRLILFMIRIGNEDGGQFIKTVDAIRLRIVNWVALLLWLQTFVVFVRMIKGPAHVAAKELIDSSIQGAADQAPLGEGRAEIPGRGQFLPDPGFAHCGGIILQHRRRHHLAGGISRLDRLEGRFRRQHAGLDGIVAAFDLGHVQEPGATADQGATGKDQAGDGLQAALVQGAGTIGDTFAALEMLGDVGMRLITLEFVERRKIGILVVQADDETNSHLIVSR